jgi:AcrR family transcriptional regulator
VGVDEERAPDTRSRILQVAADLFPGQGYIETSLSQIARKLGLTKAAVLYHFPTKDAILMELAEPMLAALEDVLDTATEMEPESARWAVVEGILDVSFEHLRVLAIANAAWVARDPVYRRVLAINDRALQIIAGPEAGLRERVRASATLALLARPALFHREDPPQDVRREVIDAAVQLLGDISGSRGPSAVPATGRADRRRVMTADKMAEARRLQAAGAHTVADIARAVGVSRATAYRYLTGDVTGASPLLDVRLCETRSET